MVEKVLSTISAAHIMPTTIEKVLVIASAAHLMPTTTENVLLSHTRWLFFGQLEQKWRTDLTSFTFPAECINTLLWPYQYVMLVIPAGSLLCGPTQKS